MSCNQCDKTCNRVVPGLLTFGLGGSASNMIVGQFTVFGTCVTIQVDTGGGIEPYTTPYTNYTHSPDPTEIVIIVTRNGKEWKVTHKTKHPDKVIKVVSVVSNRIEKLRVKYVKTKIQIKRTKSVIQSITSKSIKLRPISFVKYVKTRFFEREE